MDDIQSILNAMSASAVAPQTAAFALAAIGLNIHFGYTGLLNIGQVGLHAARRLRLRISIVAGLPLWLAHPRRAARPRSCSRSSSASRP